MKIYTNRTVFLMVFLFGGSSFFSLAAMPRGAVDFDASSGTDLSIFVDSSKEDEFCVSPDSEIIARIAGLEFSQVARISPEARPHSRLELWTQSPEKKDAVVDPITSDFDELKQSVSSDSCLYEKGRSPATSRIELWTNSSVTKIEAEAEAVVVAEEVAQFDDEAYVEIALDYQNGDLADEELMSFYEQSFKPSHRLNKKELFSFLRALDKDINTSSPLKRDALCDLLLQNINHNIFNKIIGMLFAQRNGFNENLYCIVFRMVVCLYKIENDGKLRINDRMPKEAAFFLLSKTLCAFDKNRAAAARANISRDKIVAVKKELYQLVRLLLRVEFINAPCLQQKFNNFRLNILLSCLQQNTAAGDCDELLSLIQQLLAPDVFDKFLRKKGKLV